MTDRQRRWAGEFVLEWLLIAIGWGLSRLLGRPETHVLALSTGARVAIAVPLSMVVTTIRTERSLRRDALRARR